MIIPKRQLKVFGIYLLALIPRRKQDHIFSTLLPYRNAGGPNRFISNFNDQITAKGLRLKFVFLQSCKSALIVSNSPGDYFFKLCQKFKVRSVLRVDGFYLPELIEEREEIDKISATQVIDCLKINQRLQKDLVLSDWVIYQSEYSKEMADKFLYKREKDYSIIPNGVDINHYSPQSRDNTIKIVTMGLLRVPQMIHCTLEAFRQIYKGQESELILIGHRTKEVQEVIENWRKKNQDLKDKVKVIEELSKNEIPKQLGQCHLMLHLRIADSCPNTVLESMACGVPVICHSFGGTKELVGESGRIINHHNFYDEELSQKVADAALEMLPEILSYHQKALERAREFSLDKMSSKYIEVLMPQSREL